MTDKAEIKEKDEMLSAQADKIRLLEMALNERVAEIEELRKGFTADADYFASEYDSKIKAEAIKEFAQKVKKAFPSIAHWIDNLLKEMTESQ